MLSFLLSWVFNIFKQCWYSGVVFISESYLICCFYFSSLKHLLLFLGCKVTSGLLNEFFCRRFFCIKAPWIDCTPYVVISWSTRSLFAEAGECWCPSLIWIWSHTDWLSGSANLEKEKPTNNKKYFFHTCKLSIFSILFWGQFTTVSQEAEMHIRSWFVILLTCMYFYGLLAYLKLNKDLY